MTMKIFPCFLFLLLIQPLLAGGLHKSYRSQLQRNPYDATPLDGFVKGVGEVSNPNLQAHDMVISYLGFLYHGQPEKAKIAYNALMDRHPNCPYQERVSPDRLKRNCPDCRQGSSKSTICASCKGSNQCPTCKGGRRVKRLSDKRQICPTCNGTGKCTKCDRRGRVLTTCRTCGSSGRSWNRERIMRYYKALLDANLSKVEKGTWTRLRTKEQEEE